MNSILEMLSNVLIIFSLQKKKILFAKVMYFKKFMNYGWGTCLAHSVEHGTLDLKVVSLSPLLGVDIT